MKTHKISSAHITPQQAYEIARGGYRLELSDDARTRIQRCRDYLDSKTEEKDAAPIYGVTTGFGSLCNISVDKKRLGELQKNLVMSHACGTGERVPSEIVRLILLLKIQSLSYGHSGVQVATVERLIDFFNNGVLPVIYQQGSLGASGDLAPLAHMSLPLLGLGEVEFEGKDVPASEVLKKFGWEPIELQSKEGLALLNGTQFMSAFGVWCVVNARRLSECADKIGAMSLDAFDGRIARTKKNRTEQEKRFGIQIDSLNDVVCFGVLPGVIGASLGGGEWWLRASVLFYILAALIRLAYFNVTEEERQSATNEHRHYYLGVPVTAASFVMPLFWALPLRLGSALAVIYAVGLTLLAFLFIAPLRIPKPGLKGILCMILLGAAELYLMFYGVMPL